MVGRNNYAADDRPAQVFGIAVANQMTNVQLRVLPPPMVSVIQHSEFDCCLFIFLISSMSDDSISWRIIFPDLMVFLQALVPRVAYFHISNLILLEGIR